MSDFFRRASDAFNRQRQGSADSTAAPSSPDAAKSPEEPMKQRTGSVQSESHVNEAFAGTATSMCRLYSLDSPVFDSTLLILGILTT